MLRILTPVRDVTSKLHDARNEQKLEQIFSYQNETLSDSECHCTALLRGDLETIAAINELKLV